MEFKIEKNKIILLINWFKLEIIFNKIKIKEYQNLINLLKHNKIK